MDEHIRSGSSIAVGDALTWWVDDAVGDTLPTITLTVREQIERTPYVHLTGFVLDDAFCGTLPRGWEAHDSYGGSLDDGSEIDVVAPLVVAPVKNLVPGTPHTIAIPVPLDHVVALRFGSLTNRAWVERAGEHVWLVDHERTPRLDDFMTQCGTDPVVHRVALRTDGPLRLEPLEDVLLSELHRRRAD
ncbi:hypothetical protein DEJ13_03420 [Curtobacterium sp. MCLR17_007]|uniref:hypothetical protein n=1 Tax=Curtobacterium sp. MCLR17_007 TaxID=2175648 RepID=UPI000DA94F55|nr:hypothetical protein [Curtobacterium sp. MCLR17_007]WIB60895.1 hypothetical protein DEJ13_03420 [Curtobacterium sp. MCLR17_007]